VCTVSVIPCRGPLGERGFRLACNRDEQRDRPPATPPSAYRLGDRTSLMPLDPRGRGTWIGVNDAGVAMALLNVNDGSRSALPSHLPRTSRGRLIPALLDVDAAMVVVDRLRFRPLDEFEPFRLVAIDRTGCYECAWNGRSLQRVRPIPLDSPILFTSSGLGDTVVDPPRRTLFVQMLVAGDADARNQDAFHAHRWPDRPELSVWMSRADARSVSYTTVEVSRRRVTMSYTAGPPGDSMQSLGLWVNRLGHRNEVAR
jgi:hypothetical protein